MTGKKAVNASDAQPEQRLNVKMQNGKSESRVLAEVAISPAAHAMATANLYAKGTFGASSMTDLVDVIQEKSKAAKAGDLSSQKAMLAGQAIALNAMFTEMARRAALNMGEFIGATETYMRLALKAQAQCRATIEALDGMVAGRVQTVKHVHVNDGGQAVVTDHFHNHTGGDQNGNSSEQPHATGTGHSSGGTALPSPDAIGPAVPFPGSEGQGTVPNARGQRKRCP